MSIQWQSFRGGVTRTTNRFRRQFARSGNRPGRRRHYGDSKARGHLTVDPDSDPGKAELHRKACRRVLYADAEDPGFSGHLGLSGVRITALTMPGMEARLIAIRPLRKAGFAGLICATALFSENIEPLTEASEYGLRLLQQCWHRSC